MTDPGPPATQPAPAPALLDQYEAMLGCIRCGACLPACPTYQLRQREDEGPRGRIQLARAWTEGHLALTDEVVRAWETCLLCDACTTACPAGVRMEPLGIAVRAAIVAERGQGAAARRLLGLVTSRGALDAAMLGASVGRALGLDRVPLPGTAGALLGSLPGLGRDPFVPRGQVWRALERRPLARVALQAGCVMAAAFGRVHRAAARVLAVAGAEVVAVPGQGCCGALHAHNGEPRQGAALAAALLERLAAGGFDGIVVDAAGCGAWLKHHAPEDGPPVWDFVEAVQRLDLDLDLLPPQPERRVAWQDPCHLLHAQGIRAAPRQLLERVPGLELVPLAEADQCCGSAGLASLLQPEQGRVLGERKARTVLDAAVQEVVTANPGCQAQLDAALRRLGSRLPVRHIAELLQEVTRTVPVEIRPGPDGATSRT